MRAIMKQQKRTENMMLSMVNAIDAMREMMSNNIRGVEQRIEDMSAQMSKVIVPPRRSEDMIEIP